MLHFSYLSNEQREDLFAVPPRPVTPASPRDILALALGATLYSPGTRVGLMEASLRVARVGATSMVWCLEDAIRHDEVPAGERNIIATLKEIHAADQATQDLLPLLFVRVRDADQIRRIAAGAGEAINALTGFSLPKITMVTGRAMLSAIRDISDTLDRTMYAMPILETPDIIYTETRRDALRNLAIQFDNYRENVLCIRVGGTDLSGMFGLRRDRNTTIWEVAVVRDALADITNQFARHGHYTVTGPVWEHIPGQRLFKPQLRLSPFGSNPDDQGLRAALIEGDVDALMREISMDKNNGMYGKTVIHPSHVSIVNSMLTVNREEYDDAQDIRASAGQGGVIASSHGRMNEMGPHALWAEQISARAAVYGVLSSTSAWVALLQEGQRAYAEQYATTKEAVTA